MAQIDFTSAKGNHHRFPNADITSIEPITPHPWSTEDIEEGVEYAIHVTARGDAEGYVEYEYGDGYQPDDFRA